MAIKDFPVDMSSATIDADNDLLLFADASDSNNAKKTTLTSAVNTKIDDGTTSTTKLWSSDKINTELDTKQDTLTGLTSSVAELNILDGATLTVTELNYLKGVTSAIQTQLNAKGVGTVTSVALSVPTGLTISGSPVTTTGTLAVALDTGYVIPTQAALDAKQATLVSGTNIKTVNGTSLLGSGDVSVSASAGGSDTQLQYNNGGTLAGIAEASWDNTTKSFTIDIDDEANTGKSIEFYMHNTAETIYSAFSILRDAIEFESTGLVSFAGDTVKFTSALKTYKFTGTAVTGFLDFASVASTDKTFTFPNATGTVSLIANTETLTNKTLTAPKFADLGFIADANGNELIIFDTVTSAVNELTLANAATGTNPTWTASGGDTNIGIDFLAKGTGTFNLKGNATQAAELRLYEDTDNGTNYTALKVGAQSANITYTLPTTVGGAGTYLKDVAGDGVLSWATAGGATDISVRVYNSTTVNYSGSTLTAMTFNSESYDTDTMHNTGSNTSRITFTTAGKYSVKGVFCSDTNTVVYGGIRLNGSTYIQKEGVGNAGANTANGFTFALDYNFSASDYIELMGTLAGTGTAKGTEAGCQIHAHKFA